MVNYLNLEFLGNRVLDYLTFIAILIGGIILISFLGIRLSKKLSVWTQKSARGFEDFLRHMVEKKLIPLFYFILLYVDIQTLTLSKSISRLINVAGLAILTFLGVRLLMEIMVYILEKFWIGKEEDVTRKQAFKGMVSLVKMLIWGLATILLLDNLGVKISALMAGLGIGGIAVALAAQAVLGDLFSYITIFLDRPFEIGDFITIEAYTGTVEHIGIKTTRLRSISGEQLIFSNKDLTNSRVRNYKRMEMRRVVFKLGVDYQTNLALIKEIPGLMQAIIGESDEARFDRAHFAEYGGKALVFEVVYLVRGSDYRKYMDIQQMINFRIMEEFQKREIVFAPLA